MPTTRLRFIGFWMITILGFAFHSAFPMLGEPRALAFLFPVNEAVWEHLKLGLWPVIVWGGYEFFRRPDLRGNLMLSILVRFVLINLTVLVVFYTYTLWTDSIVIVDILSYCVGVVIAQWLGFKLLEKQPLGLEWLAVIGLLISVAAFAWLSFNPPELPIFMDGRNGTYGI